MKQYPHPQLLVACKLLREAADRLPAGVDPAELYDALELLQEIVKLEPCTTPWPWMQTNHPALAEVKQTKRQIMIFIPSVLQPINNGHRIRKPSKLLLVRWVDKLPPENKHKTLGHAAKNHMKLYGGYWATDNGGYRAVQHMPELWCTLPVVVGQEWGR